MLSTAPLFCFPLPVLGLDNPSPSPGSHLPVLLLRLCCSCPVSLPPGRAQCAELLSLLERGEAGREKRCRYFYPAGDYDGVGRKSVVTHHPHRFYIFSCVHELDGLQFCLDVGESRKAFNSRHQAFCLQALGAVGLAWVPVALLRSPAGQLPCSASLSLWLDGSSCFPAMQACSLRWEQRGASWSPQESWPQGTSHGTVCPRCPMQDQFGDAALATSSQDNRLSAPQSLWEEETSR